MKIRSGGDELFHSGGRTDRWTYMAKLIVAFHSFVNEPKNEQDLKYSRLQL